MIRRISPEGRIMTDWEVDSEKEIRIYKTLFCMGDTIHALDTDTLYFVNLYDQLEKILKLPTVERKSLNRSKGEKGK